MIVKDEEHVLADCLESVKNLVSEMIIVDTGSTDRTVQIAKNYGARVIETDWRNDFSWARNLGVEQATCDWILFLDADESLDPASLDDVRAWANYEEAEAYFFKIYNFFSDTEASINPTIRMFRNLPAYRFTGSIHEQISETIQQHKPDARFVMTNVKINHCGYQPSIYSAKNKSQRNISLLLKELERNPNHAFHQYNIGVEYLQTGEIEKSLAAFQKSIELVDPLSNYAHLLYKFESRCYGALNRLEEAIESCNRGLAKYPDYTDLFHYKGTYYLAMGKNSEAEESLDRAYSLSEPLKYHTESGIGTFTTAYLLGLANEALGDDERALHFYFASYKQNPAHLRPIFRAFQLIRNNGKEHELYELIHQKFKVSTFKDRSVIQDILVRCHCYKTVLRFIENWLEEDWIGTHEKVHLRELQLECRLLSGEPVLENEWNSHSKLKNLTGETLPPAFHPNFAENKLHSLVDTERMAHLLFATGCFHHFHTYMKEWKTKEKHTQKTFEISSRYQRAQTLSSIAEQHFSAFLQNQKIELVRSAKTVLPFDEGLIPYEPRLY